MPFEPGKSGNPGGRAKITLDDGRTLTDLAREHTADAVETLARMLRSQSDAAAVSAAVALLDRGWGRPRQDVTLGAGPLSDLPAAIEQARKRVAEHSESR